MTNDPIPQTGRRPKKSLKLSKEEVKALKTFRTFFNTAVDCAYEIGIDRNVLDRVLLAGSGSPDTITKIRKALNEQ